ncbi:GAF domain-containing protein [Rhodobacter ferrooxidans]|uniref:Transcriptional regulator, Fis family n=1 Tax=Rhodobacter ferrooxidans TaxID=371731 RepID=C8S181_9RHOB|nr:GAF domain-containing protein [Rhodobacter sp. SW2]EEW25279.1 transcriptional regulator, Fis family [Rhodobacter sp. SW2]
MRRAAGYTHSHVIAAAISGHAAARSPLVASWSRSARLHKLDPEKRIPPERMTAAELAQARERMEPMIRAAGPSLDRLFQAVGGVGCCVLLADRDGVPLDRRGAPVDDPTFEDWGLWTGTLWSEAQEGTNGIGTCLAEQRAVTIHRDQHFLARNTVLSCMTAPVYDPQGQLCGALDVSSCRADLTEAFAGLISHSVAEAARRIEAEAFRAAYGRARILLVPGADRAAGALLAVDSDDLVIGATRGARMLLGLSGDLAASPRPAADLLEQGGPETLDQAERAVLSRALARAGGNVSAAARALGISRATFHRKLGPTPRA